MTPREVNNDPLWKDEFSVNTADEQYVTRRQFTKFLVLTSLAMFVGQVWILAKGLLSRMAGSPPQQTVARKGEIAVGDVKLFTYPTAEDHCIMVRTAPNTFVAYSQKCTHLSCAVYYSKASNQLECPCHKGFFAVEDGRVVAGPPTRRLPRVILEDRGDDLIAVGMKES